MPVNSSSAPIGSWTGTAFAPRRSIIVCTERSKSAPMRSILLMNAMRGTWYLSAWRQTVSDCGSTPATESNSGDGAVEDAQRALDLDGEVDVAGRVDDVDAVALHSHVVAAEVIVMPRSCSCSIQSIVGRALVDLADLVGATGVVEDALGRRRLAGVDVRHDPDVPGLLERVLAGHVSSVVGVAAGCGQKERAPRARAHDRRLVVTSRSCGRGLHLCGNCAPRPRTGSARAANDVRI